MSQSQALSVYGSDVVHAVQFVGVVVVPYAINDHAGHNMFVNVAFVVFTNDAFELIVKFTTESVIVLGV